MKNALLLMSFLLAGACLPVVAQSSARSSLPSEPGTISIEELLAKPLRLTVKADSFIYYQTSMDRVLGSMAKGTVVTLIGMSDKAFRVRGRARHGDVAGWMKFDELVMPDPTIPAKLKALYDRQQQVGGLIAAHQVGIGMTKPEVQQSLGKPTRTNSRVTAAGREERLEYALFEKVPQAAVGQAPNGQLVQSVVYVKVEIGTLSISFKNNVVNTIEETKGNPLQGVPIKIVPGPVFMN